jgi:hypothetical protein
MAAIPNDGISSLGFEPFDVTQTSKLWAKIKTSGALLTAWMIHNAVTILRTQEHG